MLRAECRFVGLLACTFLNFYFANGGPAAPLADHISDCPECIHIPLHLYNGPGTYISTYIVAHPGDDPNEVASEACISISPPDIDRCIFDVVTSISRENNLMRGFQKALTTMSSYLDTKLSRHEVMTIVKRLRGYASPRRLLVIGAGDDSESWEMINNRKEGGFNCFLERSLRNVSTTAISGRYTDASEAKTGVRDDEEDAAHGVFSRVAYEVEESLGIFTLSERDIFEKTIEVSANYSHIPWDMVLLYDFCDGRRRRAENLPADQSGTMEQISRCRQAYIDYAAERVSDDGYVFIQLSALPTANEASYTDTERSRFNEGFNLSILDRKFLYKHEVLPHLGSKRPLIYFTSMKPGPLTVAGKSGQVHSNSATEISSLTQCIKDQFLASLYQPHLGLDRCQKKEQLITADVGDGAQLNSFLPLTVLSFPTRNPSISSASLPLSTVASCNENANNLQGNKQYLYLGGEGYPREERISSTELATLRMSTRTAMAANGISRIIGILFCCRRRYTEILVRYLERNLVSAGGIIDHVLLYKFGTNEDDPDYPDMLAQQPGFVASSCPSKKFACAYSDLGEVDPRAIFLKIDDDILFLADGAVEHIVLDKLQSPTGVFVHGNGINHMHAPYFHSLLDEAARSRRLQEQNNSIYNSNHHSDGESTSDAAYSFNFEFYGRDWQSPSLANIQHLRFIDRMRGSNSSTGESWYRFPTVDISACKCTRPQPGYGVCSSDGFYRTSINLVAFTWGDIADHIDLLSLNDEIALSVYIPQRNGYHQIISGAALYAHAAFTPQRSSLVAQMDEATILRGYKELSMRYCH